MVPVKRAAVQACGYVPTPAPRLPEYRCGRPLVGGGVCGAKLTWEYVDEFGSTVYDQTPPGLLADPKKWWADLAERDIATYSAHRAAVDLMCFSWWHVHQPAPVDHDYGPVPSTCGQPMWAGPDGWACRVHGEVFPYAQ
jgi:hypothetical protein